MKIRRRRSRRYVNYGAIPAKEYMPDAVTPNTESLPSQAEGSDSEYKASDNQTPRKVSVRVQPVQQFRQNRTDGQLPSGTSLGWRTKRPLRHNAGYHNPK